MARISSKKRLFEQVTSDLRKAVFAVVRHRPEGAGIRAFALGSGFLVSPHVFLTCWHVMNGAAAPHQDGDTYHLVRNIDGTQASIVVVQNVVSGNNLLLFQQADLAILRINGVTDSTYVGLDFGSVPEGAEIGVAGYPIPNLVTDPTGNLRYDGLIYRVGKGVVTARYLAPINGNSIQSPIPVPFIEVNFLFVPGNSGGPIFRADNGLVVGFVHGFNAPRILERVQQAAALQQLPPGLNRDYIETLHAIYSLGIKMDCARTHLQDVGVSL